MLRKISFVYLILVPFASAAIALILGRSDYHIYLPLWLVNAFLMALAAWIIGAQMIKSTDARKKQLVIISLFIFIPWIFITVFAGMGPPPSTMKGWVETATEQQIRYCILIGAGVMFTIGFSLLRERLKGEGENYYSLIGFTAIMIVIPLFILNMAFWGSFLVTSFKSFVASGIDGTNKRPEVYTALKDLFYLIAVTYVALIYLAIASFAAALRKAGLFKPGASVAYIIVSFVCLALSVLPPTGPEPLATLSYITSIPAVAFIMPYLMALNLLRLAAK